MGIEEKIASAKKTKWVVEGFDDNEVKSIVELARISACIEKSRHNMGMTQKDFAEYMGVTQGMVSKWESRHYNFSIKTLNEICEKINMYLKVDMGKKDSKYDNTSSVWSQKNIVGTADNVKWIPHFSKMEVGA